MSFDEYWIEVEKLNALPQMAIQQLPDSFSEETKKKLINRPAEETAEILKNVIDQINQGSIERVDSLVKRVI